MFSSYLVLFPATLSPFCQRGSQMGVSEIVVYSQRLSGGVNVFFCFVVYCFVFNFRRRHVSHADQHRSSHDVICKLCWCSCLLFLCILYTSLSQMGISPMGNSGRFFPQGKPAATESRYPILTNNKSECWVFSCFHNPPREP